MSFCTDFEVLGKISEVELKTGGKDIQVTEENKEEYIEWDLGRFSIFIFSIHTFYLVL